MFRSLFMMIVGGVKKFWHAKKMWPFLVLGLIPGLLFWLATVFWAYRPFNVYFFCDACFVCCGGLFVIGVILIVGKVGRLVCLRQFGCAFLGLFLYIVGCGVGVAMVGLHFFLVPYMIVGLMDRDNFADNLKLPEGIELLEPLDLRDPSNTHYEDQIGEVFPERHDGKTDLVVHSQIVDGIYDVEVWCNPGEAGSVYLKAYEITRGERLSEDDLTDCSRKQAHYSSDTNMVYLVKMLRCTIYEGNWKQYYGARFELWFKPDNGGPERKLCERNYRIAGWQR